MADSENLREHRSILYRSFIVIMLFIPIGLFIYKKEFNIDEKLKFINIEGPFDIDRVDLSITKYKTTNIVAGDPIAYRVRLCREEGVDATLLSHIIKQETDEVVYSSLQEWLPYNKECDVDLGLPIQIYTHPDWLTGKYTLFNKIKVCGGSLLFGCLEKKLPDINLEIIQKR